LNATDSGTPTCGDTGTATDPVKFTTPGVSSFDTAGAAWNPTTGYYTIIRPGLFRITASMRLVVVALAGYGVAVVIKYTRDAIAYSVHGQSVSFDTAVTASRQPIAQGFVKLLPGDQIWIGIGSNAGATFGTDETANQLQIEHVGEL
jgi:hypothetical protein